MNIRRLLSTDLSARFRGRRGKRSAEPDRAAPEAPIHFRRRHRWRDLLLVTDQLLTFVRANVPLAEGLEAAVRDAPSFPLKRTFAALEMRVASGCSLSDAMRRRSRFFPRFYVDVVHAGERTGSLEKALEQLRSVLIQAADIRARAMQYAAYVGLIWLLTIVLFSQIALVVVPALNGILKDYGAPIPRAVTFMADLAGFVQSRVGKVDILLAVAGMVVFAAAVVPLTRYALRRVPLVARAIGWLLLRLPMVRSLSARRSLGHAALVMERLLHARVPLDAALDTAATLHVNPVYAGAFGRAAERVRAGESLKRALDAQRIFPPAFSGMLSMGETTGLLPESFARVGRLYRRQALTSERILLDVLSPLAILAAGGFALLAFSAVFGAILSIAEQLALSV